MPSGTPFPTLFEQFWYHVKPRGVMDCWLWTGTKNSWGYGTIGHGRRSLAHRVSLWLHSGLEAPDNSVVMHSCDTPACVNPRHLSYGTHQENFDDMRIKGRQAAGARHGIRLRPWLSQGVCNGNVKLTPRAVDEIRETFALGGVTKASLAKRFAVTETTIRFIVTGKTWKGGGAPCPTHV